MTTKHKLLFFTINALGIVFFAVTQLTYSSNRAAFGDECESLTVEVTSQPKSPVILGNTVTLNPLSITGGTAPYSYFWSRTCELADPFIWETRDTWNSATITWCANTAGTHRFKCDVTDNGGAQGVGETLLEILGPNRADATKSVNEESSVGPIMTVTHRFVFLRDNTAIGSCFSGCVSERMISLLPDGTWEPTPADDEGWGPPSCSAEENAGFYFHSPNIHDTKTVLIGDTWATFDIGDTIGEYKQWVRLAVPKCPGGTDYIAFGPLHFKIKKVAEDKVKHEIQIP